MGKQEVAYLEGGRKGWRAGLPAHSCGHVRRWCVLWALGGERTGREPRSEGIAGDGSSMLAGALGHTPVSPAMPSLGPHTLRPCWHQGSPPELPLAVLGRRWKSWDTERSWWPGVWESLLEVCCTQEHPPAVLQGPKHTPSHMRHAAWRRGRARRRRGEWTHRGLEALHSRGEPVSPGAWMFTVKGKS